MLDSNLRPESLEATLPLLPPSVENSVLAEHLANTIALHARWKAEDQTILDGEELVARQKQHCKEVGRIVFGFDLKDAQVDAIWNIFYAKTDLLLLAKTSFGKSLIFQLIPFFLDPSGVVIILMPLKLFQAKQNTMINRIARGKAIALTVLATERSSN